MDLVWPKCVSEFLYNDAILIVYNLLIIKSGFQLTVLEAKPKLWLAIHKACMKSIQETNWNSNEVKYNYTDSIKSGGKCFNELHLDLHLFLVGWESGARFSNQSQSLVLQNQTKCKSEINCVLNSRGSGPDLSPGRGYCVVFLGKTLYFHSASLQPGV